MVRPIVRDVLQLGRKSRPASAADAHVITDLRDTLRANHSVCVGMAANMIGVHKRIIIFSSGIMDIVMVNPVITDRAEPYETEESCLSLTGVRRTKRWKRITVRYLDEAFRERTGKFTGLAAQIIQHECDHLEGIII